MQRRLAAILVADVVGYSRLMEADEAGTLAALKVRRKEIVEPLVKEHGGRIVKFMGDGVLVEFGSAVNAVTCALAMQERMAAANADVPEAKRILLRIGINLGDVVGEGSDIFGDGVNVAARLEALAEPGGVCISAAVREAIQGKLALTMRDLGKHQLKNIERPLHAFQVTLSTATSTRSDVSNSDRISIAVLPLTSMSASSDEDYFSDGITEDIITELSRYRRLSVVARNTTFVFKGRPVDVQSAGRQLGVDFVVEGSVRKAGNRVRVTVQLIDVETGAHSWAERFDRNLDDIFEVQDDIVRSIVGRIGYNIEAAAAAQRTRSATSSGAAYTKFLQARTVWRHHGDCGQARELLRQAIEVDPQYADALGEMAFLLSFARVVGDIVLSPEDMAAQIESYAARAVAAAPNDAYALQRSAMSLQMIGKHDTALRQIQAALARNPRDIELRLVYGTILTYQGEVAAGLSAIEQAIGDEPSLAPGFWGALADARFLSGDFAGCLEALGKFANPAYYVHFYRAQALACLGRTEEAWASIEQSRIGAPNSYSPELMTRLNCEMLKRPEDRHKWIEASRLAGVQI